ncbi:MAG: hypothetical protein DRJ03_25550 [Chloroflexi bacterium]|nr:MAG: hypothetical protein DRJ03_25550 [Chloroflexota bacterium]
MTHDIWNITPEKLREYIKAKYKGRKGSIIVKGAIGIGKSSLVEQVARELCEEFNLQLVHLNEISDEEAYQIYLDLQKRIQRNLPPKYFVFWSVPLPNISVVDFLGKLCEGEDYVSWKPPIKIKLLQRAKHGIVFLDELNMVREQEVRHLAQRLLLDKEIGGMRNPNLLVIACCNRATDTMHVEELGSRGKNRGCILEMEPYTIQQFASYIKNKYGQRFDYSVIGFLLSTSKQGYSPYFVTLDENEDILENFATPRSWEALGCDLYDCRGLGLDEPIARGHLGREIAIKFIAFRQIKPIPPKDLMKKPELLETVKPEVAIYSIIVLGEGVNQGNFDLKDIKKVIRWLVFNNRSYLMMLLTVLDRKYNREIIQDFTWDKEVWKQIEKMIQYF